MDSKGIAWFLVGVLSTAVVGLLLTRQPSPEPVAAVAPGGATAAVQTPPDDPRLARLEQEIRALQAQNVVLAGRAAPASAPRQARDAEPPADPYTPELEREAADRTDRQVRLRQDVFDGSPATSSWDGAHTAELRERFVAEAEQGAELFAQARQDGDFAKASRALWDLQRANDRRVRELLGDEALAQFEQLREQANRRK